jgi:hypothetical protein
MTMSISRTRWSDQDNPGTYLQIVEFPSYEVAMADSDLPQASRLAARRTAPCDAEPTFRILDVTRAEEFPR